MVITEFDRCVNVKFRACLEKLNIGGKPPPPIKIPWPEGPIGNREVALNRLALHVKGHFRATTSAPEAIRAAFNAGPIPWIFFSDIEPVRFDSGHRDLFLAWLRFWNEVGAEPLNKPLVIFLLMRFDGQPAKDLCLEQFYQNDLCVNPPPGTTVLERLSDFPVEDIDDWLRLKADELGMPSSDLVQHLIPRLYRTLPKRLRLQQLEEWTLSLPL